MIRKKFKVRVIHYSADKYIVQYSWYWFIPIYHTLTQWFGFSYTGNTHGYIPLLLDYVSAEELGRNLSIEIVRTMKQKAKKEEIDFLDGRNKFLKKNIPYSKKIIQ